MAAAPQSWCCAAASGPAACASVIAAAADSVAALACAARRVWRTAKKMATATITRVPPTAPPTAAIGTPPAPSGAGLSGAVLGEGDGIGTEAATANVVGAATDAACSSAPTGAVGARTDASERTAARRKAGEARDACTAASCACTADAGSTMADPGGSARRRYAAAASPMMDGCSSCSDSETPTRAQVRGDASGSQGMREVLPLPCSERCVSANSRRTPGTAEASPTGVPCTHVVDESGSSAVISRFSTAPADVHSVEVAASSPSGAVMGVKAISRENCTLTTAVMGALALDTGTMDASTVLLRDGTAVRVLERVMVMLADTLDGLGLSDGDTDAVVVPVGDTVTLCDAEAVTLALMDSDELPLTVAVGVPDSEGLPDVDGDVVTDTDKLRDAVTLSEADIVELPLKVAATDGVMLGDSEGDAAALCEPENEIEALSDTENETVALWDKDTLLEGEAVASVEAVPLVEGDVEAVTVKVTEGEMLPLPVVETELLPLTLRDGDTLPLADEEAE